MTGGVKTFDPGLELDEHRELTARELRDRAEDEQGRRVVREVDNFELPPGTVAPPLHAADQRVVLLHITHREQRPSCERPAFRILGAFATPEAATRHSVELGTPNCSVWQSPTHALFLCCKSTARQQDPSYVQSQLLRLMQLHTPEKQDFERALEGQETGAIGESMCAREKKVQDRPTNTAGYVPPSEENLEPLSANAMLPLQKVAVICLLRDLREVVLNGEEVPEPAVAVLQVFAKKKDAILYAKHTAHPTYPACEIYVVDTYRWLYPEDINREQIEEVYGIKPLNNIMSGRRSQIQAANAYEAFVEESKT